MFTGLIQAVGTLVNINASAHGSILTIQTPPDFLTNTKIGDSISVQGICLTATRIENQQFMIDASNETLSCTTLGAKQVNEELNLELALTLATPLGGHLVTGHIDGVGEVKALKDEGEYIKITFQAPKDIAKYIARKGSICIDGVSLTVNFVENDLFDVMIIPHTQKSTTIASYQVDTKVNLEADMVARYVERLHSYSN